MAGSGHVHVYSVLRPCPLSDQNPDQRSATTMCTLEKRGDFFFLTLTGDDEHRLSPTLIGCLLSALSQVKSQATPGSILITTSQGKFFSNGLDVAWARAAGSETAAQERFLHMFNIFKPVVAALISLPMPTIVAVRGHAAAAGFILALSHDYILMRRDRGVLYTSEVDLGINLPDYFVAMIRSKIGSVSRTWDVLLRGMKVKGEDTAEKMVILKSAHDGEGALMEAVAFGEQLAKRKWDGEVYLEIRKSMYPEICRVLGLPVKITSSPKALKLTPRL